MTEKPYTKKEANKIIKEIRNASSALSCALDNITWSHYYSDMVEAEVKEEKRHKSSFAPDNVVFLTSTHDNAKYFCCKWIVGYLLGLENYYPKVDDYLHTRKGTFQALSLAVNYGDYIINELDRNKVDVELLMSVDYCRFNYFKEESEALK